jgi:putative PIN family toxin of toxin-antitoxin system
VIIVLDTNVLVSGIFWSGPPSKILRLWEARKFKLATSLEIIEEYRRIGQELGRRRPGTNIDAIIDLIAFHSEVYEIELPSPSICRDPDDDKFLACALAAKAKHIVTGDKALLELDGYGGLKILKPGPFMMILDQM